MNDSNSRLVVFLGALIATLLVVLIVVLLTDDDGGSDSAASNASVTSAAPITTAPPAASATSTPPATIGTTTPPPTSGTTMPSVTTATTAPPTTTTTATPAPLYLYPEGFGPILVSTDENTLVASGDLVFDGWDATDPPDGYWCGWGSGAGMQAGLVGAQIFDFGIGVIIATDGSVMTPEGISFGSHEVDIVAAYGPPHQAHAGPYDPNERWIYYQFGRNGYKFIFQTVGGPVWQMLAGDYDKLHLGEGCM